MAGFVHAYRPGGGVPDQMEKAAASAFSRGDLLQVQGSSVSRIASGLPALANAPVVGVALSASVESINGLVAIIVPTTEDVFLSEVSGGASLLTTGDEVDVAVDGAGRFYTAISANTARVQVVKGQNEVLGQSDQSRVLVRFMDTALELG